MFVLFQVYNIEINQLGLSKEATIIELGWEIVMKCASVEKDSRCQVADCFSSVKTNRCGRETKDIE
jgi:hypothetical protein